MYTTRQKAEQMYGRCMKEHDLATDGNQSPDDSLLHTIRAAVFDEVSDWLWDCAREEEANENRRAERAPYSREVVQ